jgi:hypothetical protein
VRADRRVLDQAGNDDITSTHPFAANLVSALACLLVFFELLAPNEFSRLTPGAFVSVPLEALLGVAFLLVLPAKVRPVVATLLGLALGLLAFMKTLDLGFFAILARPFDPVMDWTLFEDGMRFLADAIGPFAAIGCLAAAVVFSTALLILTVRAVRRLTRLFVRHNAAASRAVVVIAVPWLACAVLGTQVVPGVRVRPRAQRSTSSIVQRPHVRRIASRSPPTQQPIPSRTRQARNC